jgi:hypothetical protein
MKNGVINLPAHVTTSTAFHLTCHLLADVNCKKEREGFWCSDHVSYLKEELMVDVVGSMLLFFFNGLLLCLVDRTRNID